MASVSDILKVSFEFSSKLGVREQPKLDASKESNLRGLYVVGDLADAPIIKVAINQGHEVAERICDDLGELRTHEDVLDVIVIGAGPAGIGASLGLSDRGAHYVMLEKEKPFNTIQNFPKSKLIFSEPRQMESRGNFWFEDAQKEDLIDRWEEAIDDRELVLHQPEEVVDIDREGDVFVVRTRVGPDGLLDGRLVEGPDYSREPEAENTYRARRVILAIGRRGSVNKLGVPGEEREKVAYALKDPADHAGRKLLVVGGGDSAVEAACSCAEAGAEVTIAYRGDEFHRAKAKNQERIAGEIERGRIAAEFGAVPVEIREDRVVLEKGDETREVENDDVLVFIGTKLPKAFLERVGLRMEGTMDAVRLAWISSFALLTYLFYVLKTKKDYFPFGKGDVLGFVPDMLKVDLGFRTVDASFWGTVIYAVLILVFGVRAYRKYPQKIQKVRYACLIAFQWVFLFGIPEVLAYFIIDRPWKFYAISVPWPLSIWSTIDAPTWVSSSSPDAVTAGLWIGVGLVTSFVLMPLFVRRHGERFCSFACGCGGLAETLGDFWRHLAPRGSTSYKAEWFGRAILLMAVPVTLLILNDAWNFIESGALYDSAKFAQQWYGLVVDFWLACVIGVAFYPYLGNRVWCRFFCPLRAYMEVLAKKIGKIAIKANDKCIGCGECTRYCQMGIDVQKFAQRQTTFHNGNSACIQCGICIQVCPMEVLSIGERDFKLKIAETQFAPATGL